jgi:branched-chain amino acid transport system ATP-binding protein
MALEIRNVTVSSGSRDVVRDVSLTLEPGKMAAVLGANGAGKSELVLAVAGVLPLNAGSITIDGVRIDGKAPDHVRQAGVAAVPEGHRVLTRLSVEDNLNAAGSLLPLSQARMQLEACYELFPELKERRRQMAGTMSGGQQQMLAIGHALMSRPKYLLIDEMSLGLAPVIVKRLASAVSELVRTGTGVVLVEQFTELALSLANDVIVMRTGTVRFSGSSQQVKDNPKILEEAYF